jgi:hypothetical protein
LERYKKYEYDRRDYLNKLLEKVEQYIPEDKKNLFDKKKISIDKVLPVFKEGKLDSVQTNEYDTLFNALEEYQKENQSRLYAYIPTGPIRGKQEKYIAKDGKVVWCDSTTTDADPKKRSIDITDATFDGFFESDIPTGPIRGK